ncbi:MAG: flagellar filament capping protein FliD [Calditrichia bacterium]
MDISSIFSSRDSIEFLVSQYMSLEEQPRNELLADRAYLDTRKSVLSELDSRLSTLQNKAERLNDTVFDYFAAKKAATSDSEKFTVSAASAASVGNHSLSVERLAISDTRVSNQFTDSDTSFSGFSGDQTFTIEVAHPTDADPDYREQISVTVEAAVFSQSDDDVIAAVANAIDAAMDAAVTAGTIDNNEVVQASVVSEESGKSRLVLRSDQAGFANRIVFGSSSLLDTLGVNTNAQSSGASGGYITDPGTSASDSLLNSKFTLDGLTFYRDTNNITDAVDGVTIRLRDVFTSQETITVSADTGAVKAELDSFLESYNEVVDYLRQGTLEPGANGRRGVFADDVIYRSMLTDLRGIMSGVVGTTLTSSYDRLYNIGIEADSDGKLSFKDTDKLNAALETNSEFAADLFNSEDGIAQALDGFIDKYVKAGGTITESKQGIDTQIQSLDSRIGLLDELLIRRETQLRDEFAELQSVMTRLNDQQAFLGTILASF